METLNGFVERRQFERVVRALDGLRMDVVPIETP